MIQIIAMVFTALFLLAVAFLLGVHVASSKFTDDAINDFCETQHLRDENKWFRDRMFDPVQVVYICDRRACDVCANPDCNHTFDVRHAKNFENVGENKYAERITNENH